MTAVCAYVSISQGRHHPVSDDGESKDNGDPNRTWREWIHGKCDCWENASDRKNDDVDGGHSNFFLAPFYRLAPPFTVDSWLDVVIEKKNSLALLHDR